MQLPPISNEAISEVLRTEPGTGWEAVADARANAADSDLIVSLCALEATDFMTSFDWQTEFAGREATLSDPNLLAIADLDGLRKLMTAHVRIDRMSPGHLEGLIASGYWRKCYTRLRLILAGLGGAA